MATRLQQRRGTAAQWISTNAGAGPVLNAGEIGWESDTNKFKIGDGVNNWANLDYFADINSTVNPAFGTSITFEGATADSYETTLTVTDPTADRTITIPNTSGTIITTGNLSDITDIGVFTSTIVMEGSTADAHELTLSAGDPTADRTITFPDATGTVQLRVTDVSDTEIGYLNGVTSAIQTQLDAKSTESKTETLTNKSISLGSNTVTSTLAQLNTAISDADVATLTGTETLTNKTLTTPVISSITNGAATLTLPTSTGTIALTSDIAAGIVTETGTQTLTNKTLTSPVVSGLTLSDSGIVIEGSSADAHETTLTVTNPTADRTITFPDATGTVALTTDITASNLANDSITAVKLAGDSVTTSKIQNLAVETGKINDLAVTTGKIAEGAVTSAKIADGTIVDGDINATAAIAQSKISGLTTDLGLKAPLAAPALTGDATAVNLTISGNLTVNGTTTNINSTNLVVEDKNIVLGDTDTPTDTTADGGGITLKGLTDKTFNWVDATDAWTSSEHINLASGKAIYLNGTLETAVAQTLTNKTIALGSNTVSGTLAQFNTAVTDADFASLAGTETLTNKSISLTTNTITGTFAEFNTAVTDHDLVSLTSTSTLSNKTLASAVATTALTLNATAELRLADTDSSHYVGFKAPGTVSANKIWTLPAADGAAGQVLTTDGSGVFSFSTPAAGAAFSELMLIGA